MSKLPTKEGFYWAKWRIKAEGTADEHICEPGTVEQVCRQ